MKKIFSLLLVALMVIGSLTGCSGSKTITSSDYSYVYSTDPQNMDYTTTYRAADHEFNANYVDGLLENDSLGNYVPCLAESYSKNEDATVWTFNIRQGVKWVNSNGEEYAEVTAQDWVTALQHAAEFNSAMITLVQYVIEGLDDYIKGVTTDFSTVGVKAIDDYTLEYTLTESVPYFDTMTTYSILYPVNKEFLESKGEGCKLGAPDLNNCSFGAVDPTSILYNGGYILTNITSKSVIEMTKNASYWDAEHVYINKVTWTFDDGSDPYSVIKGFEDGVYTYAALSATWEDYNSYKEQYAEWARPSQPDTTTYNVAFNFNRQQYVNTKADRASTAEETHNAIMNKHFRLAVMFGFDKLAYVKQTAEEDVAVSMLRNTLTPPDFVTTANGSYGSIVTKEILAMSDDFSEDLNLNDGQNSYYDPAACLAQIELAKAEGVTFPVTLDLVTYSKSQRMINQAYSLKNSIEASSNGQILVDVHELDLDAYYACTYYAEQGADSDWDISTATGWGPDYNDPKTYINIYNPYDGDMMNSVGLDAESAQTCTAATKAIMEEIGLYEYDALYRAADAIKDDNDARYAAFAKCDAWLIANGFTIPVQCATTTMMVSKIEPFTAQYASSGISTYKFKNVVINEETVTAEHYAEAKAAWEKARS